MELSQVVGGVAVVHPRRLGGSLGGGDERALEMMVAVGVEGEVLVVAAAVGPSAGARRANAAAEGGGGGPLHGARALWETAMPEGTGGARALAEYPRAARAG